MLRLVALLFVALNGITVSAFVSQPSASNGVTKLTTVGVASVAWSPPVEEVKGE